MDNSYKIYASKDYVKSKVPDGQGAHQQLVTDADGVAKWEDKPFYETFAYGSESYGTDGFNSVEVGGVYKMEDAFSISLDASKRYIVAQYPGYVCDAKTVQGMKYIGNTTILGFGEDTGEPFIVVENPDTGTAAVVLKEAPTSKLFFVHDAVKTIKPIDPKYLPTIVFKKKIGAAITCNVDFATFESKLSEGAAMVMVNDGDYGLETSSNLSAYYDSDNSYWVIHAEFNSETKYYNILFSANSLSVELK